MKTYYLSRMQINQSENTESGIYSYRNQKINEIDEKVQKLCEINEYISCLVKNQEDAIDDVVYRMRMDENNTSLTTTQIRQILHRKKRKRKIIKILITILMIVLLFWVLKIGVRAIVNKIV